MAASRLMVVSSSKFLSIPKTLILTNLPVFYCNHIKLHLSNNCYLIVEVCDNGFDSLLVLDLFLWDYRGIDLVFLDAVHFGDIIPNT
jgi:hypothetical protein